MSFFADCEKLLCFRYYDSSTLECLAHTKPLVIKEAADKIRKFIKSKHKTGCNGIENIAFQDETDTPKLKSSNSLEELTSNNKDLFPGVKKKCTKNGLVRSESTNIGGTKKKIRPKVIARSPSKEYYQIWTASTSSQNAKDVERVCEKQTAPPLPPRALHRPLERSHALHDGFKPPVVPRQHKPKLVQKPEDTFGFDLIDTDEAGRLIPTPSKNLEKSLVLEEVELPATPSHKMKAALKENGRRLIGSDNYITTVLSKNLNLEQTNSSPFKENNAHPSLEAKDSQSSLSTHSSSSLECMDSSEPSSHLLLKPHKPLTRQLSPLRKPEPHLVKLEEKISSSSADTTSDEVNECNQGNEPETSEVLRPHPRALLKMASLTNNLPVCPPTPTHHAKRNKTSEMRPPVLKCKPEEFPLDRQEIVPSPEIRQADVRSIDTLDGFASTNGTDGPPEETMDVQNGLARPPEFKCYKGSPRVSLIALSELRSVEPSVSEPRPGLELRVRERGDGTTVREGEASGGIPLPLRHITTTRLPSIPERSHRILAISEIPGDSEDPLPPCKYVFSYAGWRICCMYVNHHYKDWVTICFHCFHLPFSEFICFRSSFHLTLPSFSLSLPSYSA